MAANNYERRGSSFSNGAQQGYGYNDAKSAEDNLRNELFMQQHIGEQASPIQRQPYHPVYPASSTPPQPQQLASAQPYPRHPQQAGYFEPNSLNTTSATLATTDYRYYRSPVSQDANQYGVHVDFGGTPVQGYAETDRSAADRTSTQDLLIGQSGSCQIAELKNKCDSFPCRIGNALSPRPVDQGLIIGHRTGSVPGIERPGSAIAT
ncbi:hypothetical protein K491DRAFT_198130 [Lophiostoma macrostomum CBS 122681]|uniref:Uncharacterized protein n=1 Tax=Lophiostoma macrostomum CBS 122681 TaxID=1314788 RepID=A0A6A6SNV3_9PLEO|nr:hypothetical protein K491DRAFT_198130 [Lophiostoma macrostomum CBS 122681]